MVRIMLNHIAKETTHISNLSGTRHEAAVGRYRAQARLHAEQRRQEELPPGGGGGSTRQQPASAVGQRGRPRSGTPRQATHGHGSPRGPHGRPRPRPPDARASPHGAGPAAGIPTYGPPWADDDECGTDGPNGTDGAWAYDGTWAHDGTPRSHDAAAAAAEAEEE